MLYSYKTKNEIHGIREEMICTGWAAGSGARTPTACNLRFSVKLSTLISPSINYLILFLWYIFNTNNPDKLNAENEINTEA